MPGDFGIRVEFTLWNAGFQHGAPETESKGTRRRGDRKGPLRWQTECPAMAPDIPPLRDEGACAPPKNDGWRRGTSALPGKEKAPDCSGAEGGNKD